MPDETVQTPVVTPTAPSVVESSPVVAPVAPVTQTAVEAPAAVVIPEVISAPVAPVESTSVLGDGLKPEPTKETPVEAPKPVEGEVKPDTEVKQEVQSDEPAPTPVYDAFVLPEGLSLDETRAKEFTDILSNLEVKTKAEHALLQEFGQKAVDFHVAEVKNLLEANNKASFDAWENTKNEWKESFMSDPELGGNRWQTTVNSALDFIRTHGGNDKQQSEFRDLMNLSGVGNHPAMIRLLSNAGRNMSEGRPLAAQSPVSAPKSKVATMYGSNK